jgi:hypothetical protein
VIICNLHFFRTVVGPSKNDAPLIVDRNGMLTGEFALQAMELVVRWHGQIAERLCSIELNEFRRATFAMLPGNPLGSLRWFKINSANPPLKLLITRLMYHGNDTQEQ